MVDSWRIESGVRTCDFLGGILRTLGCLVVSYFYFPSFNRWATNWVWYCNLDRLTTWCWKWLYPHEKHRTWANIPRTKWHSCPTCLLWGPRWEAQCLHPQKVYHQCNQWSWSFYKCLHQHQRLVHWRATKEYLPILPSNTTIVFINVLYVHLVLVFSGDNIWKGWFLQHKHNQSPINWMDRRCIGRRGWQHGVKQCTSSVAIESPLESIYMSTLHKHSIFSQFSYQCGGQLMT